MLSQKKEGPFELSRAEVNFYRQNGYLVVDGAIPETLCDEALKAFVQHAQNENDLAHKSIMNMDRESGGESARWIQTHPTIVNILETLLGAPNGVIALQSMFIFKFRGTDYADQAWNPHQDNRYVKMPWGTYFTANVPFVDQDVENGGMYIYPGSHMENLLPCEENLSFREDPKKNPGHCIFEIPSQYRKVDLKLKKGSCLILHGNVVHGSYPNLSKDRDRPMLLLPYCLDGVPFPKGGNANRMRIPLH